MYTGAIKLIYKHLRGFVLGGSAVAAGKARNRGGEKQGNIEPLPFASGEPAAVFESRINWKMNVHGAAGEETGGGCSRPPTNSERKIESIEYVLISTIYPMKHAKAAE